MHTFKAVRSQTVIAAHAEIHRWSGSDLPHTKSAARNDGFWLSSGWRC